MLPLAAKRSAMAWPIPRIAPVTRLTLLDKSHFMSVLLRYCSGHQSGAGILDELAERLQEPRGGGTVDNAVIERQAERDLISRHNLLADDNRAALDAADAENRALRIIDDGGKGVDAKLAEIRDGKCAVLHLFSF